MEISFPKYSSPLFLVFLPMTWFRATYRHVTYGNRSWWTSDQMCADSSILRGLWWIFFVSLLRAFQTQGLFQMSQTPLSDNNLAADNVASLKRQINVLQAQNEELRKEPCKEKRCVRHSNSCACYWLNCSKRYHLEGRAIRRLVCLTSYVGQLVAEHDRRMVLGAVGESDADNFESSDPE